MAGKKHIRYAQPTNCDHPISVLLHIDTSSPSFEGAGCFQIDNKRACLKNVKFAKRSYRIHENEQRKCYFLKIYASLTDTASVLKIFLRGQYFKKPLEPVFFFIPTLLHGMRITIVVIHIGISCHLDCNDAIELSRHLTAKWGISSIW